MSVTRPAVLMPISVSPLGEMGFTVYEQQRHEISPTTSRRADYLQNSAFDAIILPHCTACSAMPRQARFCSVCGKVKAKRSILDRIAEVWS